ncbi:hypothetical protein BU16DRAFT_316042 [Lophium mytilinum]|uniref:GPI-anchored cell wall organization protein Ecm33 n=1 Tax=Lophium mytilinum TaxID=390894 RepID=A0A6A6QYI8_9PEZI|nr:hypothetical protein BU16DRAFT_316042 [Lophium mytilinum]
MFLTLLITALLYIFERFASAACNGTTTILKQDDATALASCRTFTGDVAIATGVTDQIDFGDLARINGDLNATNVTLITSLGGTSLENIDGKFILNGVQVMTELSFPNLTNVGEIRWNALPNLNQFTFTAGINLVSVVNIQNSELSSLEGLNIKVADDVYIASNRHLTDITIPFTNINSSLVIEANGPAVSVSFPSLNWARNITIRNASSIDMPSLNYVDDILGFFGCDIEKIIVNTLSVVKGALFIAGNTHLTDISMPNLLSAGSLDIRNNTLVESIDGFGQLGKVIGNVELGGNFSK